MNEQKIRGIIASMGILGMLPFGLGMFIFGCAGDEFSADAVIGLGMMAFGVCMWLKFQDKLLKELFGGNDWRDK